MTEENIINTTENTTELTAGEMLRNARTMGRRKREIQTVAKQLCIREEFLQALEDGNYTFIPEVVYILGFARNYAIELGLDPDEIVAKIKREMGLTQDLPNGGLDEDLLRPDVRAKSGQNFLKSGLFERVRDFVVPHWKWFAAGLVVLIATICVIVLISRAPSEEEKNARAAQIVATCVAAEPKYTTPVRERFGTENCESAAIILQANQESWVKIVDARGNTVFSRVLVPGDVYFLPEGDKFKGTFGNAGGVEAWVNGKHVAALGPDHTKVENIAMTVENLSEKIEKSDKADKED